MINSLENNYDGSSMSYTSRIVRDGYDSNDEEYPEMTQDSFEVLVDKVNELIDSVNNLEANK